MVSTGSKRSAGAEQNGEKQSSCHPSKRQLRGDIVDYMTKISSKYPQSSEAKTSSNIDNKSQKDEPNSAGASHPASSSASSILTEDNDDSATTLSCGRKPNDLDTNINMTDDLDNSESEIQILTEPKTLLLTESVGDIFDAPKQTLIIHACNCQGSWGAGIAAAFKSKYPNAYRVHVSRCRELKNDLFASSQLIPPQPRDRRGHFVGCLFTSRYFGKKKDSPSKILSVTPPAMRDLLEQVREWNQEHAPEEQVTEVRMCMINSGLFAVPWEKTKAALESIDTTNLDVKEVKVVSRKE